MRDQRTFLAILGPALVLMVITGYLAHTGCSPQGGPPEKITIGTNINEMVGLLFIAEDQGYYRTQGLGEGGNRGGHGGPPHRSLPVLCQILFQMKPTFDVTHW
jgi:hypothetical protein